MSKTLSQKNPSETATRLEKQIRECFEELADELKEFRRRIDELKRRTDEVVQIDELKRRVNGFEGILVELENLGEDLHDAL